MSAQFSPCRTWRYTLVRELAKSGKVVVFIGLNPSTADEYQDDPTIRRCLGFAKRMNAKRLVMLNLYAFRATDPKDMLAAEDPIGPDNDWHIWKVLRQADLVVCAWGVNAKTERAVRVLKMIDRPMCLGITKDGAPRHPLYIRADEPFITYAY